MTHRRLHRWLSHRTFPKLAPDGPRRVGLWLVLVPSHELNKNGLYFADIDSMYRIKPLRDGFKPEAFDESTLLLGALANSLLWADIEGATSVLLSSTSGFTCFSQNGAAVECPSVGQPQGIGLDGLLVAVMDEIYGGHEAKGYKARILLDAEDSSKIINVQMLADGFVFAWNLQ